MLRNKIYNMEEELMTAQQANDACNNCVALWTTDEMETKALENFKEELKKAVMIGEQMMILHGRSPDPDGLPCFSRFTNAPVMTKRLQDILEKKGYKILTTQSVLSIFGTPRYDIDCRVMWGEEK